MIWWYLYFQETFHNNNTHISTNLIVVKTDNSKNDNGGEVYGFSIETGTLFSIPMDNETGFW